jgi:hypothetical protein
MHPWMSEQVAREHRRDLLAHAARHRDRPAWTWTRIVAVLSTSRKRRPPRLRGLDAPSRTGRVRQVATYRDRARAA